MKRSDSTSSLEKSGNIGSDQEKIENNETEDTIYRTHPLKKSFSEDTVTQITTTDKDIPLTPPAKIKSRSRLSSAFRSLRGTKSSRQKKSGIDPTDGGLITSGEEIETETKLDDNKTKRKTKLSKKFSLSIRKYRVTTSKKSNENNEQQQHLRYSGDNELSIKSIQQQLQTTATTLQNPAQRQNENYIFQNTSVLNDNYYDIKKENFQQIERNSLNENQNLFNRDEVNFVINNRNDINQDNNTIDKKYQPLTGNFNESQSSLKFERVRKIQITIKGKKIEHIDSNRNVDNLPITTTSIQKEDDYLSATEVVDHTDETSSSSLLSSSKTEKNSSIKEASISPSLPKRQSRKKSGSSFKFLKDKSPTKELSPSPKPERLVITHSSRDTPPEERAPPKPVQVTTALDSPDFNKGAIKKQPKDDKRLKIEPISDDKLMQKRDKSPLLERGRRYPRSARQSEEDSTADINKAISNLKQNPKTGNNIENPNLSGAIGVIEAKEIDFDAKHLPPLPPTPPSPNDAVTDQGSINQSGNLLNPSISPSVVRRRLNREKNPSENNQNNSKEKRLSIGNSNRTSYLSGISERSLNSELIAAQEQERLLAMPAFGDLTMDNAELAPIMTSSGDKREHLYKILIIGELGTGKTSFIKRYVHKFFSQNYRATIGVDFALKVLHWDQHTVIRLQLWDIAGQERFGNMTRVYYKDAVGAFIVFDVTRSGTFECVTKWKEDLDSKVQLPDGSAIPCILLANKCDQEKQGLVTNPEKIDEFCKQNGFAGWFETSAKENINIDEAARALVNKILLNDKLISAADLDGDKIDLAGSSKYGGLSGKKKDCAC